MSRDVGKLGQLFLRGTKDPTDPAGLCRSRPHGTLPKVNPKVRTLAHYWPIFGLRLATPRLVLTPLQDADLPEILELILAGIHEPDRMPFAIPWTDAPRDELVANALRHYWSSRASGTPDNWGCFSLAHFTLRSRTSTPPCVSHRRLHTQIRTLSATAALIEAFARCKRCRTSAA